MARGSRFTVNSTNRIFKQVLFLCTVLWRDNIRIMLPLGLCDRHRGSSEKATAFEREMPKEIFKDSERYHRAVAIMTNYSRAHYPGLIYAKACTSWHQIYGNVDPGQISVLQNNPSRKTLNLLNVCFTAHDNIIIMITTLFVLHLSKQPLHYYKSKTANYIIQKWEIEDK